MWRTMRRVLSVLYQLFVLGFLLYTVLTPWIREYTISVFASLPKHMYLIVLAVLLTVVEQVSIPLVVGRKPWPYAISLRSAWTTWRIKRRTGETFKEAFVRTEKGDKHYEHNAPFAPLDVPYLRILFIPLIYFGIPFLATLEEIMFRSYGNTFVTVLLFSVLFALAHVLNFFRVFDFILSFWLGLIFAFFYLTQGLQAAVMLHVILNVIGGGVLVWQKVFWPDVKKLIGHRRWYESLTVAWKRQLEQSSI